MPIIESVSVLTEVGNLVIEIFKAVRAGTLLKFSKEGFKTLSCLTTLEFRDEGGQQIAYYVQDRRIVFTKSRALPPFLYWSEGHDLIDELLIQNAPVAFKKIERPGEPRQIMPENTLEYSKGSEVKAALLARSIGGFNGSVESYSIRVDRWVGQSSLAIVFPENKKPTSYRIFYRKHSDAPEVERNTKEECELKKTTCSRWVLYWEFKNLTPGLTYTLEWNWTW